MSKVLFDVNIPRAVSRFLTGHSIGYADRLGWREFTNGALLSVAEDHGFEVMVTADTNLRYQQNLVGRRIAIVVLSTNAWPVIRDNSLQVSQAVDAARQGSYQEVTLLLPPKRRRPPPRPSGADAPP